MDGEGAVDVVELGHFGESLGYRLHWDFQLDYPVIDASSVISGHIAVIGICYPSNNISSIRCLLDRLGFINISPAKRFLPDYTAIRIQLDYPVVVTISTTHPVMSAYITVIGK
ncbi:hypothetical protein AGMMS50276_24660 [Synergistales bacterium]|nr:hypothetical protein AGMMS50276_24660 [Synergistales bacterium]